MSYELFVSLRHLRARRRQKFISLITWISVGGVALGVMALIVVIAVMSGFGKNLRDKILGTNSHVVIANFAGGELTDYEGIIAEVQSVDGVTAAAPFILNQVMLSHRDHTAGVVIRGIDPQREGSVSDLKKNLVEGKLSSLTRTDKNAATGKPDPNAVERDGIILGRDLARSLGAETGDIVSMISPVVRMTPLGLIPRMKIFQVAGLFESGMYQYDANLAFISLTAAQKFFAMRGQASGVEIRVEDIDQAGRIADVIQKKLGFPYQTRSWMEMNKNLFSALKMEKIVMFVILILIILVAAFNIISALFMVVMEKAKDIAIL
ncbi:MAG: ABC transporter permease, partial [Nitrospinales bacterium]